MIRRSESDSPIIGWKILLLKDMIFAGGGDPIDIQEYLDKNPGAVDDIALGNDTLLLRPTDKEHAKKLLELAKQVEPTEIAWENIDNHWWLRLWWD